MRFKSVDDQFVVVYRDPKNGDMCYIDREVTKNQIIEVDFADIVESYFYFDVSAGGFIPLDAAALNWLCSKVEVTAC